MADGRVNIETDDISGDTDQSGSTFTAAQEAYIARHFVLRTDYEDKCSLLESQVRSRDFHIRQLYTTTQGLVQGSVSHREVVEAAKKVSMDMQSEMEDSYHATYMMGEDLKQTYSLLGKANKTLEDLKRNNFTRGKGQDDKRDGGLTENNVICQQFLRGNCLRGDNCKFRHS